MSKETTARSAMKLALEALENWLEFDPENFGEVDKKAITALREALASEAIEQPAPVAKPRKQELEAAYLAGFNASGEGYNGEYPFGDHARNPEEDAVWIKDRDNALQEALAEQQEPVKHELQCICGCSWEIDADGNEELVSSPPAQQESVAVWELFEGGWDSIADPEWMETLPVGTKLYTSPPAQRKPLTDEELDLMCEKALFCRISFQQFARSIEAAHGIKENT